MTLLRGTVWDEVLSATTRLAKMLMDQYSTLAAAGGNGRMVERWQGSRHAARAWGTLEPPPCTLGTPPHHPCSPVPQVAVRQHAAVHPLLPDDRLQLLLAPDGQALGVQPACRPRLGACQGGAGGGGGGGGGGTSEVASIAQTCAGPCCLMLCAGAALQSRMLAQICATCS